MVGGRLNPGDSRDTTSNPTNPMGRMGKMPELANLAVLLMAPGADYINGQTIAIDGAAHQAGGGGFAGLRSWGDDEWQAARELIQGANEKDRAKRTV